MMCLLMAIENERLNEELAEWRNRCELLESTNLDRRRYDEITFELQNKL